MPGFDTLDVLVSFARDRASTTEQSLSRKRFREVVDVTSNSLMGVAVLDFIPCSRPAGGSINHHKFRPAALHANTVANPAYGASKTGALGT